MEKLVKTYIRKPLSVDLENSIVEAVVSDETLDRYQEVIEIQAWKKGLSSYKKHPILLSSHHYRSLMSQIGYAEDIYVDEMSKALVARFKYFTNQGNKEADWGFFLASNGLAAYSVGFLPRPGGVVENSSSDEEVKEGKKPIRIYKDVELLEVSQVVVPANPSALQRSIASETDEALKEFEMNVLSFVNSNTFDMQTLSYNTTDFTQPIWYIPISGGTSDFIYKTVITTVDSEVNTKTVIPYHKYPLAPKDTPWDAGEEVRKASIDDLKKMCAVIVGDPENKTSYKLPHHLVDGYKTVWRAVVNAAARLNQTQMSPADKDGVKQHLAKHYEDFGEKAPWEKSVELWEEFSEDPYSLDDDDIVQLFSDIVQRPETTDNYHHIPVKSARLFIKESFRTITISEKEGIKAVIGKLKSDPDGPTHIQKYLFDVDKWTLEEAKQWVKEHKEKELKEEEMIEKILEKLNVLESKIDSLQDMITIELFRSLDGDAFEEEEEDKKETKTVESEEEENYLTKLLDDMNAMLQNLSVQLEKAMNKEIEKN